MKIVFPELYDDYLSVLGRKNLTQPVVETDIAQLQRGLKVVLKDPNNPSFLHCQAGERRCLRCCPMLGQAAPVDRVTRATTVDVITMSRPGFASIHM